jgi:hypothetical protein
LPGVAKDQWIAPDIEPLDYAAAVAFVTHYFDRQFRQAAELGPSF